jgi:flagellar hook-associated protein FlgK
MPEQIGVLSSGKSIEDGWFDIQIHFGNALGTAQTGSDIESATVNQLANLLASETAVSIDEELILMNQANQSFDAAGALIRAAEEMSATLINLVG